MAIAILKVIFWVSLALAFYAYAGYPIVLWLCSRMYGRDQTAPALGDQHLPSLSFVIAAHNEAAVIAERVRNLVATDYPANRLEMIVASDGSDDGTVEIVQGFTNPNLRVLDYRSRRGKAAVLNDAIRQARGDVIVFSDANTFTDPQAARRLARWFHDPSIGVACGRLILTDPATGRNVDSLYWRYETTLKRLENRLGALLGANGAIYALRRSLFRDIGNDVAVDDFVIPLLTHLRTRCRLVYDAGAVAFEESPAEFGAEFKRRSRIGAGGFQSLAILAPLLHPRHGWIAFAFWSHKVLRWTCPFWLVGALLSSLLLIGESRFFTAAALGQLALYAAAVAGYFVPGTGRGARALRLTSMFAGMNVALLVGFWLWASRRQQGAWQRTAR